MCFWTMELREPAAKPRLDASVVNISSIANWSRHVGSQGSSTMFREPVQHLVRHR